LDIFEERLNSSKNHLLISFKLNLKRNEKKIRRNQMRTFEKYSRIPMHDEIDKGDLNKKREE
jgi:hypothetical protein